jgi:hypothetical protein
LPFTTGPGFFCFWVSSVETGWDLFFEAAAPPPGFFDVDGSIAAGCRTEEESYLRHSRCSHVKGCSKSSGRLQFIIIVLGPIS